MKHAGQIGVARLGDSTSHGGKITTATTNMVAEGIAVAREGDMTHCPKCRGDYAILASEIGKKNSGKWVAYNGTKTACGATLISSL